MSDENTNDGQQQKPETATPDLETARQLLLAEGHQVLPPEAFHRLKVEAAAPHKQRAETLEAELAQIKAEREQLAEFKRAQEDQGKSQQERDKERIQAWQKADEQKAATIAEREKEIERLNALVAQERVENRIRGLVPDATNPEAALMWAQKHVGARLSTDETGQLVWTEPTGVPHTGVAAEKMFRSWWDLEEQAFLRRSPQPGPKTAGAPSAPPKSNGEYQPLDPRTSTFQQRLDHAREYMHTRGN